MDADPRTDTKLRTIAIFGANGATGLELCRQALAAGHRVIAAVRRPDDFPLSHDRLAVRQADVMDAASLASVLDGADAVCSTLGVPYSRHDITLYSTGTRNIVAAMRAAGLSRLIVVSAGLTYPPPRVYGFVMDRIVVPLLRKRIGRTLYADMRRMEELLDGCDDIDWTIMRPSRLEDRETMDYTLDGDFPLRAFTSRPALARAMLTELANGAHIQKRMSPTTR